MWIKSGKQIQRTKCSTDTSRNATAFRRKDARTKPRAFLRRATRNITTNSGKKATIDIGRINLRRRIKRTFAFNRNRENRMRRPRRRITRKERGFEAVKRD